MSLYKVWMQIWKQVHSYFVWNHCLDSTMITRNSFGFKYGINTFAWSADYVMMYCYKCIHTHAQPYTLRWRHNDHAGVSNHQPHGCLLNCLFRRKSKKTSKLRVTGLCAGNSPETGEFPAQMASYAEIVSIWWRHHETLVSRTNSWADWPAHKSNYQE